MGSMWIKNRRSHTTQHNDQLPVTALAIRMLRQFILLGTDLGTQHLAIPFPVQLARSDGRLLPLVRTR
ncbi:hypothetical protein Krac_7384 [Ktedonobacter racemifer DSM 44963]|uniref:Uncharacterized protein n=1 Tax=Ktedonobacter racemifer DSM 44963 TaxID=485913 RepID=D6TS37_KTERA|nr:hypothetical protein Krac_7384 [Ktedonobacter racemifer DSM 44963]